MQHLVIHMKMHKGATGRIFTHTSQSCSKSVRQFSTSLWTSQSGHTLKISATEADTLPGSCQPTVKGFSKFPSSNLSQNKVNCCLQCIQICEMMSFEVFLHSRKQKEVTRGQVWQVWRVGEQSGSCVLKVLLCCCCTIRGCIVMVQNEAVPGKPQAWVSSSDGPSEPPENSNVHLGRDIDTEEFTVDNSLTVPKDDQQQLGHVPFLAGLLHPVVPWSQPLHAGSFGDWIISPNIALITSHDSLQEAISSEVPDPVCSNVTPCLSLMWCQDMWNKFGNTFLQSQVPVHNAMSCGYTGSCLLGNILEDHTPVLLNLVAHGRHIRCRSSCFRASTAQCIGDTMIGVGCEGNPPPPYCPLTHGIIAVDSLQHPKSILKTFTQTTGKLDRNPLLNLW